MSSLSRRYFFSAAAGLAAAASTPRIVFAQASPAAPTAPTGPFVVPALAYPTNALEPHIDARTMEIHHDKHHGAYVANLNNLAKTNPQQLAMAIELMMRPDDKTGMHPWEGMLARMGAATLPLVLLVGPRLPTVSGNARLAGWLAKPFSVAELVATVRLVTGARSTD